ncbi:ATP-binding response regulator [Sphingomonas faeni]|uniref:ATP-binding response regulator n=1 Tax=Sphingomonas faeni TaxID=185950 RepID=UPI0033508265
MSVSIRSIVTIAAAFLLAAGLPVPASAQPASTAVGEYEKSVADAKAAMLIDPVTALAKAVVAERYAERIGGTAQRGIAVATARWLRGEAHLRSNDSDSADLPLRQAIAAVTRHEPRSKLQADVLLSLGWLDSNEGRAGNALIDFQRAYIIYRRLLDARGQSRALVFLASLYTQAMDPDTADKYYDQALDVYKSDINMAVSIYNNRGLMFAESGQFAKGEIQLEKALVAAKQLGSHNLLQQIYINIARVELDMGKLAKADRTIASARQIADQKDSGLIVRLDATEAQSALQHGQPARAKALLTRALGDVDTKLTGISFRDVHQTAYDVFRATGDWQNALVHLQALKRLDDNATKLATSTKTALMAARFDFANQELKISQLKASDLQRSIAFERSRAQTQRYIFLGAAAAVAVVIALLAFGVITLRRSRDQVRAANDDLAVTNSALGKALAAKTEFLATTSHEIRTPLNGILGMTQVMLADATLAPVLRDRLGVVHSAGVTMRALVDDILDVAKMETGNLTIESAPFDLRATVTDATRMWEEQARAKGLSFKVDLGGCPTMIIGDAARVRQIVFNLLSNALKFTQAGRVALTVDVDADDRLRAVVTDSGIGIPADKLDEIFESFRQADAGTTRQFGGTGLGLSICRNLARAMGGDVTVDSRVGQGTNFTLVLPLVRAEEARVAAVASDTGPVTLVVDRNPITRSMFKTLLAPHGAPVMCVVSADDAVLQLEAGNVARVLIDDATIRVGGDTHAALSRIAAAAASCDAETTLLWPVSAPSERDELLATGITRVVAKPVSGGALVATMFDMNVSKNNANADLVPRAA